MKGIKNLAAFLLVWTLLVVVTFGIATVALMFHLYLLTSGRAARAERAVQLLAGTLMPGEEVVAQALQHRVFALARRRLLLAITSSRIIRLRRGLIGGFTMQDPVEGSDRRQDRAECLERAMRLEPSLRPCQLSAAGA